MSNPTPTTNPSLQACTAALQQALGDNLLSLTLYGSAARGTSQPGVSDANVLIVLDRADLTALAAIRGVLTTHESLRLSPYLVTHAELPSLAHAFPTRILEMKRGYQVLFGQDVLASLPIDPQVLDLRARQELLNIHLRFRHQMLNRVDDNSLEHDLETFLQPFLKTLRAFVFLRTGNHIDSRKDLIETAAALFGLDKDALLQLSAWRSGKVSFAGPEWTQAATAFFNALQQLSQAVDA